MSESQFPRSLFPQFTEGELEKASKSFKSSVNWTEYNKWVEAGRPYEEHDEVLMNLELKNGSPQKRSDSKSIDMYSFCYFIFMYMFGLCSQTYKILFKEVNGRRECGNRSNNHKNSGNRNRSARKTSIGSMNLIKKVIRLN